MVALANLIGQFILQGITLYNELKAQDANVPPLTTILAQADTDWNAVLAAANAQLGTGAATPARG
jgi:hypothetical protein